MLRISRSQLEAFEHKADDDLRATLCRHYLEIAKRNGLFLSSDTLTTRVAAGVRKARDYGLTHSDALTAFVGMIVFIQEDFDAHPPIKAILMDSRMRAEAKVRLLGTMFLNELSPPRAKS